MIFYRKNNVILDLRRESVEATPARPRAAVVVLAGASQAAVGTAIKWPTGFRR
jgi:hypothetical protein